MASTNYNNIVFFKHGAKLPQFIGLAKLAFYSGYANFKNIQLFHVEQYRKAALHKLFCSTWNKIKASGQRVKFRGVSTISLLVV